MAESGKAVRLAALAVLAILAIPAFAAIPHASAIATPQTFDYTAFVGPRNLDNPAYSPVPVIPAGWSQRGSTITGALTNDGAGAWGTANGTAFYDGQCVFSGGCGGAGFAGPQTIFPFSAGFSALNNDNVACGTIPADTPLLVAASQLTVVSGTTMHVDMQTDDGAEVYIASMSNLVFSSLFSGNAWIGQGITDYSTSIALSAGDYLIVIEWFNDCGPGVIGVQFSGLPAGSLFTANPYLVSQPQPGPMFNPCESGLSCSTSALVFSTAPGATVTLSASGRSTLIAQTNLAALIGGICGLQVNATSYGCLSGETGQFIVSTGVTYSYTVQFSDGKSAAGTVSVVNPWTVAVVSVPPQ